MIVDDDPDDIEIFIDTVKKIHPQINCLEARNGRSGIDLINSSARKPDYIFVDMNMPKLNGKQFIAEIRKNKAFDNIKLVLYSTSNVNDYSRCGADYFVTKPIGQEELLQAILKVISDPAMASANLIC
jgi:CheY-like chemotaxis protein